VGRRRPGNDDRLLFTVDDHRYIGFNRDWSAVGTHALRQVVLGTPGRPRVDIDAFKTRSTSSIAP